jgi:hypothetical protein
MITLLLIAGFGFLLASYWLLNLVIFGVAKITKKNTTARYAGKMLLVSSGVGVLFSFGLWILLFPSPTRIYRSVFNENPSPDVSHLQGFSQGYDSGAGKLRFQAAPSTIKRLARIQKLPLMAPDRLGQFDWGKEESPDWWNPQVTTHSQLYAVDYRRGRHRSFYGESVMLLYDPQTRTAFYSSLAHD